MKKTITIILLLLASLFFSACSNNNASASPIVHKKLSGVSKDKVIRIRFINSPPFFERLLCKDYCDEKCKERIVVKNMIGSIFNIFSEPKVGSIGMTETQTSREYQKNPSFIPNKYYSEYEILGGSGNFRLQYYYEDNIVRRTLAYEVYLEAGKEYEIYYSVYQSYVYEIEKNGQLKRVKTSYPPNCTFLDKLVK